jgi:NAD(P)H-dependent FMN reductase
MEDDSSPFYFGRAVVNTMKITALVGSYRKGGVIDSAVDEILASAVAEGADVSKIYLTDVPIEFCANCRSCTQQPGEKRGSCPITDGMSGLLDELERSDSIVLASPMNFWTVTAVTKRFVERLVCYSYWPWGMWAPKMRITRNTKRAVVVASSAAPAFLARFQGGMVRLLKAAVRCLGAKTCGVLFIGLSAKDRSPSLSDRTKRKAQALGKRLAAPRGVA